MTPAEARALFVATRVARLATVRADGWPRLVPLVHASEGDTVYSAVDHKPKRSTELGRLDDVRAHPGVALLADSYDEDWSRLWWVRADGVGRVLAVGDDEARHAVALLVARYEQYADTAPAGPVLAVDVTRWSGWSAADG
jgi:PPOX class probable F420-dependent enzyme